MRFHIILKSTLLVFFVFYQQSTSAQNPLEHYCQVMNGEISNGFHCPKSRIKLGWDFCIIQQETFTQFFDGCTGPIGRFESQFTPACIKHDLCYHHEPATSGKSQEDCDNEFRLNLAYTCYDLEDHDEANKCLAQSVLMFLAVRAAGKIAYHCDNTPLD